MRADHEPVRKTARHHRHALRGNPRRQQGREPVPLHRVQRAAQAARGGRERDRRRGGRAVEGGGASQADRDVTGEGAEAEQAREAAPDDGVPQAAHEGQNSLLYQLINSFAKFHNRF